ncbi:hypothetical protein [Hymenobacter persicinus]|uniref:Uncharacterized protein n=1 Tax=Hymenobacter persicinus TaxID=2025506 RepID=A0A4Q5LD93_9BACT|nr:hypothetical protein [Hymenobacter persicinus]RYU81006.1 hypothetical protein EWM57_07125 [Hymenobacter persicinus]
MLPPLLLDFSAADARWLGGIVWKAAVVLWLPQLLMLWLVLAGRTHQPRSRGREVALLLLPVLLGGVAVCSAAPWVLLLVVYAEVRWDLWLLVLGLPTLAGILVALATNTTPRTPPAASPARAAHLRQTRWTLGLSGLVVGLGVLATVVPPGQPAPTDYRPTPQELEQMRRADQAARAEQARQDSVQYHQHWDGPESQPQDQPPPW